MRILLADDDHAVRRVFQYKLEKLGHDVATATDGDSALAALQAERFDVLVSDIRMPGLDGIELLERARSVQPHLKVILITAHATVSQAVQAVKLGAFDYITKPFDDDELFTAIERAGAFRSLEDENRRLRGRLRASEAARRAIGVSPAFKEMMSVVERIAPTDATVLLLGESGTGKELIARTLHMQSARADGPFVAVNCGAIPRELVESELFGHVRGAFTGATRDKKGRFEQADGGTILLDEVGELPLDVQVKLLRVLQERVVEPVGAETTRAVDVRVVAATHVDLAGAVEAGRFREDLYYRLHVIPVRVPPLRERADDVVLLAREFARRFAGDRPVTLTDALLERLRAHDWPGNVRELENLMERMVLLRRSDTLDVRDLPPDFGRSPVRAGGVGGSGAVDPAGAGDGARRGDASSSRAAPGEAPSLPELEARAIRDALERAGWNRSKAARELGIARHVLLYRMKKYGIEPPEAAGGRGSGGASPRTEDSSTKS